MGTFHAALIGDDGYEPIEFASEPSFRDYYNLLGCSSIQPVEIGGGLRLWIDESGVVNRRGLNAFLTLLAYESGVRVAIFGPGLIVGSGGPDTDVSLSDLQVSRIDNLWESPSGESEVLLNEIVRCFPEVLPFLDPADAIPPDSVDAMTFMVVRPSGYSLHERDGMPTLSEISVGFGYTVMRKVPVGNGMVAWVDRGPDRNRQDVNSLMMFIAHRAAINLPVRGAALLTSELGDSLSIEQRKVTSR